MEINSLGKATRREWIGLVVLVLACVVYSMDLTVLILAVPKLTADLQPSASELLWITDIYGFMVAGLLITMGTLGDRIGRKKLLLAGAGFFSVASIFAAFAPTSETLIAARAVLGIAGATLAPSTLALIRNMFHDETERTFAISMWVAGFSGGAVFGPIIGGALLTYFWWGSVFLLALPVMLLILCLGPFLLPESKTPDAGRPDVISAALSIVAVLSIIFGLKKMAENGFDTAYLLSMMFGAVIGVIFVRRQLKLADPLIDMGLFLKPGFSAVLCINFLGLFVAFGFFMLSAQYLQMVLGYTPMVAGLWMLPTGLVFMVMSLIVPLLVGRWQRVHIIAVSFAISCAGFLVLSQLASNGPIGLFLFGSVLFCLGLAPIGAIATDIIMGIAPPERAGAAASISETSFEFGAAAGIAVVGSIATVIYRLAMVDAVPAGMDEAVTETLGAALAIGETMADADGAGLIATARLHFTEAMCVIAVIGAGFSAFATALALALLRPDRVRPAAE